MKRLPYLAMTAAWLAAAAPALQAGTFTADFNDGMPPAGTQLFGNGTSAGVVEPTGGVGDSGVLKLTKAVNGVQGSMIIDDLDAGATVNGFTATFKMRIGGGSSTPADGCSFVFGNDLTDGAFGEEGVGSGLRIAFDIYNNAGEAPAFRIYWGGVQVATSGVVPIASMVTGADFVDVLVRINPTGTLDLTYNGTAVATNLNIGFVPIAEGRFGFGGRTGGLNANQFVDDISITTTLGEFLLPNIIRAPLSARVIAGYPAPMNVVVGDPENSTFQWERQAPGAATFTPVAGATEAQYVAPALTLADAGTQYRVVVTNTGGITATSAPAIFDVVSLPHALPNTASFNFNDDAVPPGTNAYGNAAPLGGIMSLTEAINTQAGTWTVDDLNAGLPVGSIDIAFKLLMSPEPDAAPADGFGFHWAPDLPEAGFPVAEEPVGTGLSVTFDVYNSGNNEAPAVDVFWLGTRVGGINVPGELLDTQEQYVDVQIRLSGAGLVDVAFNGVVLVYQLQVPNWTSFSNAKYGFSARTGGLNQRHYLDDVQITSTPYVGPIGFVAQPQAATALVGRTATFQVTSNDPSRSAYQWQRATGGGAFADIGGATGASYTTPTLVAGDNGSQYRVVITSTANATVATSDPATLTVVDLVAPASPQILNRFDDLTTVDNEGSVPDATQTLSGNAVFMDGGGNGFLQLTEQVNTQFGTLVISDFNEGNAVGGFTASMKVQITGENPADGWSFSWGSGITPEQVYGDWENGLGNDLRVNFITYGGNPAGRRISVVWRGTELARSVQPLGLLQTAVGEFEEVLIRVTPASGENPARIDVAQDGVLAINNVAIPNLQGLSGASFALAARTGGLNELHGYDDVAISTTLFAGPISVATQLPATLRVLSGSTIPFVVASSNPPVTTYQWQRAAPGTATFVNVGTNSPEYTTPALTLADNGVTYQVVLTGPGNVVTSTPTVVSVVEAGLPATFDRIIDFNDSQIPDDGALWGSANILAAGGIGDSPVLELTAAVGSLQGSFVLSDLGGGSAVNGFVTRFNLLIGSLAAGNATNPPADGASFVWSPTPIGEAFGEGGIGTGLIVAFDVYDNDDANPDNETGEAPAVEVFWNGETLGNIRVPRALMETGLDYREVIVRVNPTGTLDVIFGTQVIFWNEPLPGFLPMTGSALGWGARTGGANAQQNIDDIQLSLFLGDGASLNVTQTPANIVITFTGTLETSTDLTTWTPLPEQTSPLVIPKAGLTGKTYYRSRP